MIISDLYLSDEDVPYLESGMDEKVDRAQRWIQANQTEIGNRFFEDIVEDYLKIRPHDYRAFMFCLV